MAKERLIWRPNEIAPRVWEAMSREDQIAWWKAQQQPSAPKLPMRALIGEYDEGNLTLSGFVCYVCQLAAVDEIDDFMRACPEDLLAELRNALAAYGDDENNWPRTFHIACHAPWVTDAEIVESQRREQERIWLGVKLLKPYFSQG